VLLMHATGTIDQAPRRVVARTRVLVVDDDGDMRSVICGALRRGGFDVTEASDGDGLVDAFAEGRLAPDVVVSDVEMAHRSGLSALAAIRDGGIETPVVLVTASTDPKTRARARLLGASAVLEKPIDLGELRRVLGGIIDD
jgi:two-component system, response regulator, stage 0 sporulation protein F